jgi:hypothetical protein
MDSARFASGNWDFWIKVLFEICQHFELPCRPFSELFAVEAFAKLERCSARQITDMLDEAGKKTDKSLGGKPMVRAVDFFEVFCSQKE